MAIWAGSAVSKFAEWVGSSVVNKLVSTAYSNLRDRMLPANTEAELKRLKTALPQITAVMGIAEALKMKDPSTSLWVDQFRHAVEESHLVLNELENKNQDEAGESASSSKKRKRYTINDVTLKRLREAVTMMDRATTEIDRLLRLATVLGVHGVSESRQDANKVLRREINLCLAEREVFRGRKFVNLACLKHSSLEIDHTLLSDIEPLWNLRSLRHLEIQFCSLPNSLESLIHLSYLHLSVHDASPQKSLPSIARLKTLELIWKVDLSEELPELPASLEKKDIKGHGYGPEASIVGTSNQPDLSMSLGVGSGPHMFPNANMRRHSSDKIGLEAFQGLTCSRCSLRHLKVTSSDASELKDWESNEVGESSHSNEFIVMDVD